MGRMGRAARQPMRGHGLLLSISLCGNNRHGLHLHRHQGGGSHVLRGVRPSCLSYYRGHRYRRPLLEVRPSSCAPQAVPTCLGTLGTMRNALLLRFILGSRGNGALAQQLPLPHSLEFRDFSDATSLCGWAYARRASCRTQNQHQGAVYTIYHASTPVAGRIKRLGDGQISFEGGMLTLIWVNFWYHIVRSSTYHNVYAPVALLWINGVFSKPPGNPRIRFPASIINMLHV